MSSNQRDENRVANIAGVSSISYDGSVEPAVNPSTHALKTESSITALSSVGSGKTTVTTAGTQVVLSSSTATASVTIKALATNTGYIYVGASTVSSTDGFQLQAGEVVSMDVDNLSDIWIDSSVNGEGVSYIYAV